MVQSFSPWHVSERILAPQSTQLPRTIKATLESGQPNPADKCYNWQPAWADARRQRCYRESSGQFLVLFILGSWVWQETRAALKRKKEADGKHRLFLTFKTFCCGDTCQRLWSEAVVFLEGRQNDWKFGRSPSSCVKSSSVSPSQPFAAWRAKPQSQLAKPRMALKTRGKSCFTQKFRFLQNLVSHSPPLCRSVPGLNHLSKPSSSGCSADFSIPYN